MPLDFQSRVFTHVVPDEEHGTISADLPIVLELTPPDRERAISLVRQALSERTKEGRLDRIDDLKGLKLSRSRSAAVYRFTQFFLRHSIRFHTKDDSAEDLVHDLLLLAKDSNLDEQKTHELIKAIQKEARTYDREELERRARDGVLPFFVGCGTGVELRGVFDKQLRFGEKAHQLRERATPEADQPPVPVVSVAIAVDTGTPERFSFQLDLPALDFLIEKLRFAQLQAQSLADSITYAVTSEDKPETS